MGLLYKLSWCGMIMVTLAAFLFRDNEFVRIAALTYCVLSVIGVTFYLIKSSAYLRNIIAQNPHAIDKFFIAIDEEPQLLTFENKIIERAVDDGILDEYEEPETINRDTQPALAQAVRLQQLKDELANDAQSRWVHSTDSQHEEPCGVCFGEITKDALSCPECNKAAHSNCIRKWIRAGNTACVYCRAELIESIQIPTV